MCCFSLPVYSVSATNIFAREAPGGRQYLAYAMTLHAAEDLAMILPLPVAVGSREGAVDFIDLSGYPTFFDDLLSAFPEPMSRSLAMARDMPAAAAPRLAVVDVGSFEASFVPTLADFERLDPRFRLPASVWSALPRYARYGFAVFKLKSADHHFHPMAFTFPRAEVDRLFFPTVHIHDGKVHEEAHFDHALYCQFAERAARTSIQSDSWRTSDALARMFLDAERSRGLVDPDAPVHLRRIRGPAPNRDVVVAS